VLTDNDARLKLLVIADDLSGATDVAVQFSQKRIKAIVLPHARANQLSTLFSLYEVVLVDAQSRHLSPELAGKRVADLATSAARIGVNFFYKKTDSTLRGNIGAELEALLTASGRPTLCFVPAHPVLRRTTRLGIQYLDGKPLHESSIAVDPFNPVGKSDVFSILREQTKLQITVIQQSDLSTFIANPPQGIAVFDAETAREVQDAATAIKKADCLQILAGPAALASCLPDFLPFDRSTPDAVVLRRPFILINGSLNPVAFDQCAHGLSCGFEYIALSARELFAQNYRQALNRAQNLLGQNRDILVSTIPDRNQLVEFQMASLSIGIPKANLPNEVALATGAFVRSLLEFLKSSNLCHTTLIIIGGDTLAGIAQANDWTGFIPQTEILPGVAVCKIPDVPELTVITKPGAFGSLDFISQLIKLHR
jgi:uncharacterized protein YgbK (DUF1537 family)